MIIAIDFDDTFTLDVAAWTTVIAVLQAAGHTVVCVTSRHRSDETEAEFASLLPGTVKSFFAAGTSKKSYMMSVGIDVDVWIDDSPDSIPTQQELEDLMQDFSS